MAKETTGEDKTIILVVDDEAGPRESLKIILKSDFLVTVTDRGSAALELLRTGAFAVLLLADGQAVVAGRGLDMQFFGLRERLIAFSRRKQALLFGRRPAAGQIGKGLRLDLLFAAAGDGEGGGAEDGQRDGSGTCPHGILLSANQSAMKCGLKRDRSCVMRPRSSRVPRPTQTCPTIQAPMTGRKPSKTGSG